jgi:alkylhydroperoxidase family enzyme
MSPRIAPVEPPYAADTAAELARWMPPGSSLDPLQLFRTLVRNLPLAETMLPLGRLLLSRRFSPGTRVRELVIDRVCARCDCEYEWGVHVAAFAAAAGLDERAIRASATGGPDDPAWSAEDALVIRLVDGLHDTGHVSDELWGLLAAHWTPEQLLELLVLVGWYHLIAFVANGARVALEPWAARFPARG